MEQSAVEQLAVMISTPLYVVLILTEIAMSNWQHKRYYTLRETLTNLLMMLANMGIDLLFRGVYVLILLWFYQYHFVKIDNFWLYWATLFFLEDFMFYVLHVVDHYCRFFWAVHVTHHSSEELNLTTGFRSSVFQPLYRFVYFIPLTLLGFAPMDIVVMYSVTQIYGILVHTNYIGKLWQPIEYFFVTPSHHRVHHASNVAYLDKNMGMVLIIWDRIFGTYQEEIDGLPIAYGLTTPIENRNIFNMIFHEWKKIGSDLQRPVSWRTKLKYVFAPPGWSHDGSTHTSNELRALAARNSTPKKEDN